MYVLRLFNSAPVGVRGSCFTFRLFFKPRSRRLGGFLLCLQFINRAAVGGRGSRTAFGFFNRAAEGGRGSRIAFGFLPRSRRRARSCFAFGLLFLNRAAVGWAVSCSAFGLFFLNRATVGWAVSCFAFGLFF